MNPYLDIGDIKMAKGGFYYSIIIGVLMYYLLYFSNYGKMVLNYIPSVSILPKEVVVAALVIFIAAIFSGGPIGGLISGLVLGIIFYEYNYYVNIAFSMVTDIMTQNVDSIMSTLSTVSDHVVYYMLSSSEYQMFIGIAAIVGLIAGVISKKLLGAPSETEEE